MQWCHVLVGMLYIALSYILEEKYGDEGTILNLKQKEGYTKVVITNDIKRRTCALTHSTWRAVSSALALSLPLHR